MGEAEYFVIVNESTDVTRQEHDSLSTRFTDKNCEPRELFLGFYATEDASAATPTTIILDTKQRMNQRGQAFTDRMCQILLNFMPKCPATVCLTQGRTLHEF